MEGKVRGADPSACIGATGVAGRLGMGAVARGWFLSEWARVSEQRVCRIWSTAAETGESSCLWEAHLDGCKYKASLRGLGEGVSGLCHRLRSTSDEPHSAVPQGRVPR